MLNQKPYLKFSTKRPAKEQHLQLHHIDFQSIIKSTKTQRYQKSNSSKKKKNQFYLV